MIAVLGNVVAVMSVIAVVAIIDGMNTYVSEKILEQGLQVITIDKFGLITDDKEWEDAQKRRDLTTLEADALAARILLLQAGRVELANVRVLGTTANYEETSKFELDQGRHLEAADVERRRPVCVIGSEVAEALSRKVHVSTVSRTLDRLGLPRKKSPPTPPSRTKPRQ